jgi:hypothetical protein
VRVAIDAFVAPMLERRAAAHSQRLRAGKTLLVQMGLDTLQSLERVGVVFAMNLQSDP